MTKSGANDWKTPLGYYERAIAEIRKAREEFRTELKNLKETQTSSNELQKLTTELNNLQEELQTTKKCLETTQKTANEFQARIANAEKAANDFQTELKNLKANLQPLRLESGIFSGNVKITSGWKGVLCCDHQGNGRSIRKYIRFSQSFSNPPKIVGLSYEDVYTGANHRIKVIASDIDSHGFFLEIHTWLDTQVWGADVNWLAYGY